VPPSRPQGAAHQNVVASKVWGASCPIKVGSRSPGYVGSIGKRGNGLERGGLEALKKGSGTVCPSGPVLHGKSSDFRYLSIKAWQSVSVQVVGVSVQARRFCAGFGRFCAGLSFLCRFCARFCAALQYPTQSSILVRHPFMSVQAQVPLIPWLTISASAGRPGHGCAGTAALALARVFGAGYGQGSWGR
jgi:hypothetical protein